MPISNPSDIETTPIRCLKCGSTFEDWETIFFPHSHDENLARAYSNPLPQIKCKKCGSFI